MSYTRRDWLKITLGGAASSLLLGSCTKWLPNTASHLNTSSEQDALYIFGMGKNPSDTSKSILYCANTKTGAVQTLDLPIFNAHLLYQDQSNPRKLLMIGMSGDNFCRIDFKDWKVEKVIPVSNNGLVSGGHAWPIVKNGKTYLIVPEYNEASHGKGFFSLRDSSTMSILHRLESRGSYPHSVGFIVDKNEFFIENIGHRFGEVNYTTQTELTYFDADSLQYKRRSHPGHDGVKHIFLKERTIPSPENDRFRKTAAEIFDYRKLLFSEPFLWIEHHNANSISLWNRAKAEMLQELHMNSITPIHVHFRYGSNIIIAAKEGLYFIPKNNLGNMWTTPAYQKFHTDLHIFVMPQIV